MTDVNLIFTRELLKSVNAEVKKYFPEINLKSDVWVYNCYGQYDFGISHKDHNFQTYVSGWNAYEAKANGLIAFLKSKGIDA